MRRLTALAPIALLLAGGCLASKSDIRLLQDELRATRAQLAMGDTSILRADDARRAQITQLSNQLDRAMDSLRAVATRLATFQANAAGNFDAMNQQMYQIQQMMGQNTRNLQETRAQVQALREQAMSGGAPTPPATAGTDTTARAAASGVPGPATLYGSATESINQGAYSTGRRALEQLLASYPTDERAPRALLRIGETYAAERNLVSADSVYRLVAERFPKNEEAGTALYRVGKSLWDSGKRSEARTVLQRVIRDYPSSDAAKLAKETLNPRE